MLPHYYLDDARGEPTNSALSLSRTLCVCVYMLVGCHVNKLYMAVRLCACVCAKNCGVLDLNLCARIKVCYDFFVLISALAGCSLSLPPPLYLLLIMPLHFISCIWLHAYIYCACALNLLFRILIKCNLHIPFVLYRYHYYCYYY